jgi:hypothetical protein
MLGDELESGLADLEATDSLADTTPSYLMPSIPSAEPGGKISGPGHKDEFGLPTAPIGNP